MFLRNVDVITLRVGKLTPYSAFTRLETCDSKISSHDILCKLF